MHLPQTITTTQLLTEMVVEHMLEMNCTAREAVQILLPPHLPDKLKLDIISAATDQYILRTVQF